MPSGSPSPSRSISVTSVSGSCSSLMGPDTTSGAGLLLPGGLAAGQEGGQAVVGRRGRGVPAVRRGLGGSRGGLSRLGRLLGLGGGLRLPLGHEGVPVALLDQL